MDPAQIRNTLGAEEIFQIVQKDMMDCDREILFFEELVLNLKKKKNDLAQYIAIYRSQVSPIHRLPVDILVKIFLLHQDRLYLQYKFYDRTPPANDSSSLLTLALVCKEWQSVILSTPQLWSRFNVTLAPSRNARSTHNWVKLCLSRSAQLPLSFQVYINDKYIEEEVWEVRESVHVVDTLVMQCHRWSYVVWITACDRGWFTFPLRVERPLPLLRTLKLVGGVAESPNRVGIFAGARSIRALAFDLSFLGDIGNLSMRRVKHLHIVDWRSNRDTVFLRHIAKQCPRLRSLKLSCTHGSEAPDLVKTEIRFEVLERLTLEWFSWDDINDILSLLTLPSLRQLSLHYPGGDRHSENVPVEKLQKLQWANTSSILGSRCPLAILAIKAPRPQT